MGSSVPRGPAPHNVRAEFSTVRSLVVAELDWEESPAVNRAATLRLVLDWRRTATRHGSECERARKLAPGQSDVSEN